MIRIISRIVGVALIALIIRIIASIVPTLKIEKLSYTILEKKDKYEIRQYDAHIEAQVVVTGDLMTATNRGFTMIAGYIFGGNTKKQSIAMTAPVITNSSSGTNEKIAMTAPVVTQSNGDATTVSFVMPKQYTLDTLPTPNDNNVKLVKIPGYKAAVYKFGGTTEEAKVKALSDRLLSLLKADNIQPAGEPSLMRFDPPRTMRLLRHNEIVVQIK